MSYPSSTDTPAEPTPSAPVSPEVLCARLTEAEAKIAHLEVALTTNRQIGAAIGILMGTRRIGYDAAFELMRRASQGRQLKLREIADQIVYTGMLAD